MTHLPMLKNRGVALVVSATALALIAGGGGAVAASLITSADIKDKTIQTVDLHKNAVTSPKVKDRSLKMADLNQYVQDAIEEAGPQGPKGDPGARGATGPAGPTSVISTATHLTAPNPAYGGANVVDIPPSPLNASNDGRTPMLTFTLDAGKYYMSASAQFFHLGGPPSGEDYGVFGTLMNGVIQPGNSVSPNIPDIVPNPAQTTAGGIFIVPANNTQITVVGSIRGTVGGQGGVAVEVLKIG